MITFYIYISGTGKDGKPAAGYIDLGANGVDDAVKAGIEMFEDFPGESQARISVCKIGYSHNFYGSDDFQENDLYTIKE